MEENMSDHDDACEESRNFCDGLYQCLSKKIPNLNKKETLRWCGLYQKGKKRFVYINHRKRMFRIEVWCLGDPTELQRYTTLNIEPRKPTTGGFGKLFQARFFIDHLSEIDSACELLYQVSYRTS